MTDTASDFEGMSLADLKEVRAKLDKAIREQTQVEIGHLWCVGDDAGFAYRWFPDTPEGYGAAGRYLGDIACAMAADGKPSVFEDLNLERFPVNKHEIEERLDHRSEHIEKLIQQHLKPA